VKGRIRLNRDQALLLEQLLAEERHRAVITRAQFKSAAMAEDVTKSNRYIESIERIQDEVNRTIDESWPTGL
jgi:hypothetical protein